MEWWAGHFERDQVRAAMRGQLLPRMLSLSYAVEQLTHAFGCDSFIMLSMEGMAAAGRHFAPVFVEEILGLDSREFEMVPDTNVSPVSDYETHLMGELEEWAKSEGLAFEQELEMRSSHLPSCLPGIRVPEAQLSCMALSFLKPAFDKDNEVLFGFCGHKPVYWNETAYREAEMKVKVSLKAWGVWGEGGPRSADVGRTSAAPWHVSTLAHWTPTY